MYRGTHGDWAKAQFQIHSFHGKQCLKRLSESSQCVGDLVETHVEKILLDVIKDKQCLQLVEDSQAKIKGMKKKKIIRAYAVQELPQLTSEELEELRKAQLARQSIE